MTLPWPLSSSHLISHLLILKNQEDHHDPLFTHFLDKKDNLILSHSVSLLFLTKALDSATLQESRIFEERIFLFSQKSYFLSSKFLNFGKEPRRRRRCGYIVDNFEMFCCPCSSFLTLCVDLFRSIASLQVKADGRTGERTEEDVWFRSSVVSHMNNPYTTTLFTVER